MTDYEIAVQKALGLFPTTLEDRRSTAMYSTCPEILEALSRDAAGRVRLKVALNLCTPAEVLFKLRNDENVTVQWYAEEQIQSRGLIDSPRSYA